MKTIFLFVAVLLMLSCCEESSQKLGKQDLLKSSVGDTIIYYRNPDVSFFKLPPCNGKYICPSTCCIQVDCDTPRIFTNGCPGVALPLRCVSNKDTTSIVVMISGIQYPDRRYNVGDKEFIKPNYNGLDQDAPHGSQFDAPPAGEPSASSQGLSIDKRTGYIDLDKSIEKGLFGDASKSGDQKTLRIYYKLNDMSHYTRNYADVTFVYGDPSNSRLTYRPGVGTPVLVKSVAMSCL